MIDDCVSDDCVNMELQVTDSSFLVSLLYRYVPLYMEHFDAVLHNAIAVEIYSPLKTISNVKI